MNDGYNDFEQGYTPARNTAQSEYNSDPRWDDFTIDDEIKARKRFSRFFLACFVYLATSFVLVNASYLIAVILFGIDQTDAFFSNPYVNMAVQVLFMYVISLPIFYLIVRNMRNAFRIKKGISIKEFIMLFLIAEACMYGGSLLSSYITDFIYGFFNIEVTDNITELVMNTPLWLVFVVAVVIGPIVEEFIYRKLLMDKLGIYGDRIAIVVSAISFGIFHGDISQLFYATLIGFVLAYLYSKTANVWICALMHAFINFFGSIVPMLIMESADTVLKLLEEAEAGLTPDNISEYYGALLVTGAYSLFTYGVIIAGVILFFKYRKSFFVSDRCEVLIPKHKRASVIVLNAGAITFIIFTAASMALNLITPILESLGA